jgi:hypothetical protein
MWGFFNRSDGYIISKVPIILWIALTHVVSISRLEQQICILNLRGNVEKFF